LMAKLSYEVADALLQNIIPKNNAHWTAVCKMLGQTERGCDSTFTLLISIVETVEPELCSVAKKLQEVTSAVSTGNYQYVVNARIDQGWVGIINHALIEAREEVFFGSWSEGRKCVTKPARQDNAFHLLPLFRD